MPQVTRSEAISSDDGVLLLHGIARSSASMRQLEGALAAAGFATLNVDYPSRRADLATLADHVQAVSAGWIAGLGGDLHFVTHSMGGLVARAFVTRHRPARLGRIVMLAPPNQGSEIADLLDGTAAFETIYGPAGAQLTTERSGDLDALLGPVDYPLGIIAGDRSVDPLGWAYLPKPNDGKVTVARTEVTGMADHLVLPVTHTFLMRSPLVIAACLGFLREGRFPR